MEPSQLGFLILAVGGLVIIGVLTFIIGIFMFIDTKETPVRDRLLSFQGAKVQQRQKQKNLKEVIADYRDKLIVYLEPHTRKRFQDNKKLLDSVRSNLSNAGLRDSDDDVWRHLGSKLALAVTLGGGLFIYTIILSQPIYMVAGVAGFGALVGYRYPDMVLKRKGKTRRENIKYTVSDFLDLMVVCVQAGLSMDATVMKVSEEARFMAPELSLEFRRLSRELNAGISRQEAFKNLGVRTGVDEINSLCTMIIQADKMGTNISDTLKVYAESIRVKRQQQAEELASKASIKMTFPLVMCILPTVFIVLLGPGIIRALAAFNVTPLALPFK